jgi:hypothetical protein
MMMPLAVPRPEAAHVILSAFERRQSSGLPKAKLRAIAIERLN